MAILGNISCSVEVDQQALKEIDDPEYDGRDINKAVKYIEVKSGIEFRVRVKFTDSVRPKWNAIGVRVYINGAYRVNDVVGQRESSSRLERREVVIEGVYRASQDGSSYISPFIFKDIEHPQSDLNVQSLPNVADLGLIEVKVLDFEETGVAAADFKDRRLQGHEKIPEKLLKGSSLSHAIMCGEERLVNRRRCVEGRDDKVPLAYFVYKYRSHSSLQSLLLIPRSPSPTPTREQLEERIRTLEHAATNREMKVEAAEGIKRERDEEVDEILASARVNRRRKATGKYKGIALIDLDVREYEDAIRID